VLESTGWYVAAMAIVFAANVLPAFMPSTWMVLAFFRIQIGLPLLALTIGGSIAAAAGRWLLAKASGAYSKRYTANEESDLRMLGAFLQRHQRHVGLTTFLYTLSPLPSNNLFIAAGMVAIEMTWVVGGFLAGRLIANTVLVWTTDRAFEQFGEVLKMGFSSWEAIAFQSLSAGSIVLLAFVPWAKWLRRYVDEESTGAPRV
jgi:hypothetical protein